METAFKQRLQEVNPHFLNFESLQTLQLNLGNLCNLSCAHCHMSASPFGQQLMEQEVINKIVGFLKRQSGITLDLTGGCPELNPNFRFLIEATDNLSPRRIVRSNLTILHEPGMEWLPEFYCKHDLVITASSPCSFAATATRRFASSSRSGSFSCRSCCGSRSSRRRGSRSRAPSSRRSGMSGTPARRRSASRASTSATPARRPSSAAGSTSGCNQLLYAGPILAGATLMDHVDSFDSFDEVGDAFFSSVPARVEGMRATLTSACSSSARRSSSRLRRHVLAARAARRLEPPWLKIWLVASTGFVSIYTWGFNSWGQAFLIMNLFHAVQYLALVWAMEGKRIAASDAAAVAAAARARRSTSASVLAYGVGGAGARSRDITTLWAITMVVSLMHFWYDAFVWSVRRAQV